MELLDAARPHQLEFHWVRGHNGHPQNEYANLLATRAAKDQTESGGAVESRFEQWLEDERARTRRSVQPDPLPDPSNFKPGPALPVVSTARLL